jgi:hypothetical protein
MPFVSARYDGDRIARLPTGELGVEVGKGQRAGAGPLCADHGHQVGQKRVSGAHRTPCIRASQAISPLR